MGKSNRFDLEKILISWDENLKNSSVFTRSDIAELKSHLLDIYENMLNKGLDKEEAFIIAVKRLGKPINWEKEFAQTNQPAIQTRRTILLIAGVILYYCSYYLSLILAKLIVIIGKLANAETIDLIRIDRIFLGILLLLVILFFNSLLIKERFLMGLLEKIQFRPRHAVFIVILTFVFAIIERSLTPFLNHYIKDPSERYSIYEMQMYFEYIYLFLLVIGFVVLYFRYFRQTKSPRT